MLGSMYIHAHDIISIQTRTAMTDGASGSAARAAATAATAFEAPVEGSIGGSVRRAECRTTGDASGAAFEGSGEGIPDA